MVEFTETAALVRKMREALTHNGGTGAERMARARAIAAADQWLAQQRGPLTGAAIGVNGEIKKALNAPIGCWAQTLYSLTPAQVAAILVALEDKTG